MPGQSVLFRRLLHPVHAILLAFPIALFSGGLAADITFLNSAVIQWSHFAAWLIAGGVLFGGIVLVWAAALAIGNRAAGFRGAAAAYLGAVAIMWIAGLINAFQHSRDGWSSVGTTGLVLSIVSTIAALAAGWIGHSGVVQREPAR